VSEVLPVPMGPRGAGFRTSRSRTIGVSPRPLDRGLLPGISQAYLIGWFRAFGRRTGKHVADAAQRAASSKLRGHYANPGRRRACFDEARQYNRYRPAAADIYARVLGDPSRKELAVGVSVATPRNKSSGMKEGAVRVPGKCRTD